MARPTKQGIDYFPVDCQFDPKTEMYLVETEGNGLAVLITLWQLIYSDNGYYIEDNHDLCLLIKKRINVSINDINDCIKLALNRGVFNKIIHNKYKIITSKAIQKRFFEAAKRKKIVDFDKRYIINGINVSDNAVNVDGNATKEEVKEEVNIKVKEQFEKFWDLYDKKVGNIEKLTKKFSKLSNKDIEKIMIYIPKYKKAQPDKTYRKNPETFLNNKSWNDEIIESKPEKFDPNYSISIEKKQ